MKLPHLDWVNHDSPYLRQWREGFRLLRFDGEMEAAYNRYHARVFLLRMRWSLLVAIVLFLAFAVLDTISLPGVLRSQTLTIRLGVIGPMLLLTWLATYR